MARFNKDTHKIVYRRYASSLKYALMVLSVALITFILPKQQRFKYEFAKGTVWLHEDLVSPYNYAIKKTSQEIERDRDNILKSVLPVYRLNDKIVDAQLSQYQADFEARWKEYSLPEDDEKERNFEYGFNVLKDIYNRGIIGLNQN
ncbi:transmembrane HD family protein, partial [Pseudoxanthomonas sp. SGD-10]